MNNWLTLDFKEPEDVVGKIASVHDVFVDVDGIHRVALLIPSITSCRQNMLMLSWYDNSGY